MSADLDPPTAPAPRAEAIAVAVAVLVTRILIALFFYYMVNASEFSEDVRIQRMMLADPFASLLGRASALSAYPPLLSPLVSLFAAPLRLLFGPFLAFRFALAIWETLTALLLWAGLARLPVTPGQRRLALVAWVTLPVVWITTALMAQDEIIAALFAAAMLYFLARDRPLTALVTAGFAVVTAKLFFVLPAAALVVAWRGDRLWRRAAAAFLPVALVYGWVVAAAMLNGGDLPLVGYRPPTLGVSFWIILHEQMSLSVDIARRLSSVLTLIAVGATTGLFVSNDRPRTPRDGALLAGLSLLWVLLLFDHTQPEYFIMPLPFLLAGIRDRVGALLVVAATTLPWVVNLCYGVAHFDHVGGSSGKGRFVEIFQSLVPLPAEVVYHATLVLSILATLALTANQLLASRHRG